VTALLALLALATACSRPPTATDDTETDTDPVVDTDTDTDTSEPWTIELDGYWLIPQGSGVYLVHNYDGNSCTGGFVDEKAASRMRWVEDGQDLDCAFDEVAFGLCDVQLHFDETAGTIGFVAQGDGYDCNGRDGRVQIDSSDVLPFKRVPDDDDKLDFIDIFTTRFQLEEILPDVMLFTLVEQPEQPTTLTRLGTFEPLE
jgi:hypothetical protein